MKKIKFKIPIYDFSVTWLEIQNKDDKDAVLQEMSKMKCQKEDINDVIDNIERECMNGGSTFRNMDLKKFLVIVFPCSNETIRRDIVNHEKRHIEDRLLKYVCVDDIEACAYLAGYLSRFIY